MSNNSNIFSFLNEKGVDKRLIEFLNFYSMGKRDRTRKMFTNELHYEIFKHLPLIPKGIHVSKNYVLIEFEREYERKKIWDSYRVHMYSQYLVGINSDGKLFINKVDFRILDSMYLGDVMFRNYGRVEAYFMRDEYVMHCLGYDVDLENGIVKSIPIYSDDGKPFENYRVQGDLRLSINAFEEVDKYYSHLVRIEVFDEIFRILSRIVLERVSNVLAQYNIPTEWNRNILASLIIPRHKKDDEIKSMIDEIVKLLEKEIYLSDMSNDYIIRNKYRDYTFPSVPYDICIEIDVGRGTFGFRYLPMTINVRLSNEVIDKFTDHVMKNLRFESDKRVIYFGRHKITYEGYPFQFTIATQLPLLNLDGVNDEIVMNINLRQYHMAKGKMTIEHVEHGKYEYNVERDIVVSFGSTLVHRENDSRLGYYALKNLKI
jgi:hypothetical protein